MFNDGGGGLGGGENDPTKAADAGTGFLMRRDDTIISSGWDPSVASGGDRLAIKVP